jgi:hypothetical protein
MDFEEGVQAVTTCVTLRSRAKTAALPRTAEAEHLVIQRIFSATNITAISLVKCADYQTCQVRVMDGCGRMSADNPDAPGSARVTKKSPGKSRGKKP